MTATLAVAVICVLGLAGTIALLSGTDPFHAPFAFVTGLGIAYAFWGFLCAVGDAWEWVRTRRGL